VIAKQIASGAQNSVGCSIAMVQQYTKAQLGALLIMLELVVDGQSALNLALTTRH